jgi:hypothetical protein
MKKNLRLFMLLACILTGIINVCNAQTQFWSDDLESGGPSSGSRTSSYSGGSGGPPNSRYFKQTTLANINAAAPFYSGIQGSQCWAAEDVDGAPTGVSGEQSSEQSVTWSNISIAGKTGLTFRGLFATTISTVWDHGAATILQDYLIMQYQLNGTGSWITFLSFQPNMANMTNGGLAVDNNGDGLGDGTVLNNTFTDFVATLSVTGTTINIRCQLSTNSLQEEIAFDNFRLFETTCTAPTITGNPPNRTICAGNNTTFSASATGATSYQWQVDQTGGGTYTNLSNATFYSGVTTNTLTITGATAAMNGYRYRAAAINGVASCFTNSNHGTLTVSSIATSGSQTNIACYGGASGNATVFHSGGISPYTYSWSPAGGTGSTASGLSAGTYTVTVTDAISCQATRAFTITQPSAAVGGSNIITNVYCFGGTNGSIDLTPSGGTPGYTYNWGGGIVTQDRTGLAAGNYSVTITDANGCTGTVNASITHPSAVSGSNVITNVACFGGTNGTINLTPSGGTPGYTYNWGGGITTQDRISLAAGSYSVIITDANACTGTVNATITQPTLPVSGSTVITNVSCFGGSTGSINLTPSGGTPGYTYNWTGGTTTQDRTGLAAGSYSVTITDDYGCTGIVNSTVTGPSSTPGSNSFLLPASNQTVINTVSNSNYVTASCELVSSVVASGASPVGGSVTNKVWIEGAVPTQSGMPFVQRHYEITPATNASTATGTITLYFTQTEFDNFNAHAASSLNLPADANDAAGKANLRIGKYSGISGNGTGLPSSYSSSTTVIDPDDNDIVWNTVSNAWEVTFPVAGFSGFIVQTAMFTLPVNWLSFTVSKRDQSVILNWSTATEQNTKDFIVQHSVNGVNWNNAVTLSAAGNSSSARNYSYVHSNTAKGFNYYRVVQIDMDGKTSYSEVRMIDLAGDDAVFTIQGNKISNGVLQLQIHQKTTISFYEVTGKLLWKKQFTSGLQQMDVSRYAKGVYLLNAGAKVQKILIQ